MEVEVACIKGAGLCQRPAKAAAARRGRQPAASGQPPAAQLDIRSGQYDTALFYARSTVLGEIILGLDAPVALMRCSSHSCLVDPVQRRMLFWAEHCRSQPSAIRESLPVVSSFALVSTLFNPSCATIRRELLQTPPRGEGPLLACRYLERRHQRTRALATGVNRDQVFLA